TGSVKLREVPGIARGKTGQFASGFGSDFPRRAIKQVRWNELIRNRFHRRGSRPDFHNFSARGLAHGSAGDPSGTPGCLEIEASGQTIQVEQLSSKIEPGADTAFHGFEIHFAQTHSATSNE